MIRRRRCFSTGRRRRHRSSRSRSRRRHGSFTATHGLIPNFPIVIPSRGRDSKGRPYSTHRIVNPLPGRPFDTLAPMGSMK